MARAVGVRPPLVLPVPPEKYDVQDQRELRQILQRQSVLIPDWSTLASVPTAISEVSTHTAAEVQQVFNQSRSPVVITTAALANLASEASSIAMPFTSGALLTIQVDRACWVRLYAADTDQTTDAARAQGTLGTPGTGLLAEFQCGGAQTVHVSPVAILANDETILQKRVWYAVMNKSGSTSTVTATLGVLKLEA